MFISLTADAASLVTGPLLGGCAEICGPKEMLFGDLACTAIQKRAGVRKRAGRAV